MGLPSVRPCRTPAVTSARSLSIFIRPPRPWPSWRRARSRSMSSGRSSRPAGSPSTTAVSPGPCDSPAVVKRSAIPPLPYWRVGALLLLEGDAGPAGERLGNHALGGVRRGRDAGARRRQRLAVLRCLRRGGLAARAELLAPDGEQLQVVADAAVDGAEGLLVGGLRQGERDELARALRVALALALGVEARVVDEEQRALVVAADAQEHNHRRGLVGQQGVGRDALVGLRLLARLAEAEV